MASLGFYLCGFLTPLVMVHSYMLPWLRAQVSDRGTNLA